jgi:hypothetical protein
MNSGGGKPLELLDMYRLQVVEAGAHESPSVHTTNIKREAAGTIDFEFASLLTIWNGSKPDANHRFSRESFADLRTYYDYMSVPKHWLRRTFELPVESWEPIRNKSLRDVPWCFSPETVTSVIRDQQLCLGDFCSNVLNLGTTDEDTGFLKDVLMPEPDAPHAFWSYARFDDAQDNENVFWMCKRLAGECHSLFMSVPRSVPRKPARSQEPALGHSEVSTGYGSSHLNGTVRWTVRCAVGRR